MNSGYSITDAIVALRPGAQWTIYGTNYDSIVWHDIDASKPTIEEVHAKITQLQADMPMQLVREERNRRLSECDWVTLRAASRGEAVPTEWAQYMQELRDLPNTISLESNQSVSSISWPTKPN